jgi:hypothetical protein
MLFWLKNVEAYDDVFVCVVCCAFIIATAEQFYDWPPLCLLVLCSALTL